MNVDLEYCDPFDGERNNIWMKAEHCGRYLFASDRIAACESAGGKVLDAACADGYGTEMLCSTGWEVTGADRSEDYLALARKRQCPARFVRVDFDLEEMPFQKDELDAVVCFETIEHLDSPGRLVSEFARILQPGGLLLLSFPNALYEKTDENGKNKDPFHKHIFPLDEILRLMNPFFEVHEILGQFLCNQAYALESGAVKAGILSQEEISALYRYDPDSVRVFSRALAYPCDLHVDDSYSYILVARRK